MKKTDGLSSDINFLKVFIFGLNPAELTPINLKDLFKPFLLFLFPLFPFCLISLTFTLICFLISFLPGSLSFSPLMEVLDSLEHSEKPTLMTVYHHL